MKTFLFYLRLLIRWSLWTLVFAVLLTVLYLFDGLTPGVSSKRQLSDTLYALQRIAGGLLGLPPYSTGAGYAVIIGGACLCGLLFTVVPFIYRSLKE